MQTKWSNMVVPPLRCFWQHMTLWPTLVILFWNCDFQDVYPPVWETIEVSVNVQFSRTVAQVGACKCCRNTDRVLFCSVLFCARVLQRLGLKDSPVLHLLKTTLYEAQLERCNLRLGGCRCLSLCKLGSADSHRWFKERQITADANNRIERWGKYVRAQIKSEPALTIAEGDGGWV